MADGTLKWYVVHTYSGYENKVAGDLMTTVENRGLQDMITEVKVPTEIVTENNAQYPRLHRLCRTGIKARAAYRRGGLPHGRRAARSEGFLCRRRLGKNN